MGQLTINIGSAPNDGSGDPLRTAFDKCNQNFTDLYTNGGGGGGGSGTVTSVSVVSANGVSASVSNPTTTPAMSFSLGAITPSSVNGVALSGSSTPSLAVTGSSSISGSHSGTSSNTNTGDVSLASPNRYLSLTGQQITPSLVDLASHVTGDLPLSNLAQASVENVLLGRGVGAAGGDFQQITIGSGLSMSGTTLTSTASGGAPTNAEYLVGALNGTLTNERLVGNSTSITANLATSGAATFERAALTGDVTASANSNATSIAAGVVTTTKLGGDITTAGKALLDDVDAAAQRTTLGLGTLATQNGTFSGTSSGNNSGDVTLAGTPTYITISGQTITRNQIALATDVSGTLPIANGGTGVTTSTGTGSNVLSDAPTFTGQVTVATGTAAAPAISFTGTTTGIYNSGSSDFSISTAGTQRFVLGSQSCQITYSGNVASPAFARISDPNTGLYFPAADTLGLVTGGVESFRVDATQRLLVQGTNGVSIPDGAGAAFNPAIVVNPTSGVSGIAVGVADGTNNRRIGMFCDQTNGIVGISTNASTGVAPIVFRSGSTEHLRIDTSGRVGIGTASPSSFGGANTLSVLAENQIGAATISAYSTSAQSANFGGNILLGGNIAASGTTYAAFAEIRGRKENSTAGNYASYLSFCTRANGVLLTEQMRITSAGSVLVNTAAVTTTATDGFLYIPSCAGIPTGTPTTQTGRNPLVIDSTNSKLYFYNGSWVQAGGGAGGTSITNVWIPAAQWIPRTTTGCGIDSREQATGNINTDELLFDTATIEYAQAMVTMPSNYNNGTVTARFSWTASAGTASQTVTWSIRGRAFGDNVALGQTYTTAAQSVTDAYFSANQMHISDATSAVTIDGTPAANKPIIFEIYRDTADTLAADARLLGVEISYTAA